MNLIKFLKTYQADIILGLAVALISVTAFNLGKISAVKQQKTPVTITQSGTANRLETVNSGNSKTQSAPKPSTLNLGPVVASKASKSKAYHFPWCPAGSRISEKNKITFATEAAAIAAGYTLAGNCTR